MVVAGDGGTCAGVEGIRTVVGVSAICVVLTPPYTFDTALATATGIVATVGGRGGGASVEAMVVGGGTGGTLGTLGWPGPGLPYPEATTLG